MENRPESANAIDGFVRGAAIGSPKCSALLSTSVLGKLHYSVAILGQCLQWAVQVIRHWGRIADILHRQVVPQSMR